MALRRGKTGTIRLTGADMRALRLRVFKRDQFTCVRCGCQVTWDTGEMAHRKSRGAGGSDTDDNCETSCRPCHRAEHCGGKVIPPKTL